MTEQPKITPESSISPAGDVNIERLGLPRRGLADVYHRLIATSWPRMLLLLATVYLAVNSFFALAYMITGGISNARPGSFVDAFFFSVQTIATIGYGVMAPQSVAAHLVVIVEVFVGLVGLAVVTGITFNKFARPTARVRFSHNALISQRDGIPTLMFRMANQRGSTLVEARAHVVLIRNEVTLEGESLRRFSDLKLVRDSNLLFALSWSVNHPIDAESPLFGATPESLVADDAAVIVSVLGIDETLGQPVHARHAYTPAEILWNARFADIITMSPEGHRVIDYNRFDAVIPAP